MLLILPKIGLADNATTTANIAGPDTTPPVISNVATSSVTANSAIITWSTNEKTTSTLAYGTSTSTLNHYSYETTPIKAHSVTLTNLSANTKYYFQITSEDESGNSTTENNGGSYYSFTTLTESQSQSSSGGGGMLFPIEQLSLGSLDILLNNGAQYTKNPLIQISFQNGQDLLWMRFGEQKDLSDLPWQEYSYQAGHNLSSGDGKKTIYFEFKDSEGFTSEIISRSIILDTLAPAAPVDFNAGVSDKCIALSWSLPSDGDLAGVRIFKSKADYILNPFSSAELAFEGKGQTVFDCNIAVGQTYFYSAFSYDYARNYSTAAVAQKGIFEKKPAAGQETSEVSLPVPQVPLGPKEKALPPTSPKSVTEKGSSINENQGKTSLNPSSSSSGLSELAAKVRIKTEKLPIRVQKVAEAQLDLSQKTVTIKPSKEKVKVEKTNKFISLIKERQIHYLEETPLTIKIEEDNFYQKPQKIILEVGDKASYAMVQRGRHWEARIETPSGKHSLGLKAKVLLPNASVPLIIPIGSLLVDPRGYVYQKVIEPHGKLFEGGILGWKMVARKNYLHNARVTLYQFDEGKQKWVLFLAQKYGQENPQLTDQNGKYSFMVPPGKYYLKIAKSGFGSKQTKAFKVENSIVNQNIELSSILIDWWRLKTNMALEIIIFGIISAIAVVIVSVAKKIVFH